MADARMNSVLTSPNQFQTWDFYEADGIVPILENNTDKPQAASIAAFIQLGTIPQLPQVGIPWVEFFLDNSTFNQVDGRIKGALSSLNLIDYYPEYDLVNDNIVARINN